MPISTISGNTFTQQNLIDQKSFSEQLNAKLEQEQGAVPPKESAAEDKNKTIATANGQQVARKRKRKGKNSEDEKPKIVFTDKEISLMKKYWNHKLFLYCRLLGILFVMIAIAADFFALIFLYWYSVNVIVSPSNSSSDSSNEEVQKVPTRNAFQSGEETINYTVNFSFGIFKFEASVDGAHTRTINYIGTGI